MHRFLALALLLSSTCCGADKWTTNLYAGIGDGVLPQVADGNYWKTTVTVVNMDDEPAQYKLQFFRSGGSELFLDFVGLGRGSFVYGTLPVNGSFVIETTGTSNPPVQGFAVLTSPNYKTVNGYGIFRQRIPGRPQDFEAVTPLSSEYDDDFILPFDNTQGNTTSMAICNPSTYTSQVVTVAFYDGGGTRFLLDQFTLNPLEHTAYEFTSEWPLTNGKRGTAVFQVSPYGASVLGLRFNRTGPFTSTHTLSR
jgi:hypothetical protein